MCLDGDMEKEYLIFRNYQPFLLCVLGFSLLLVTVITIYFLYPGLKWLHYGLIVIGSIALIFAAFKIDVQISEKKTKV